MPKLVRKGRWNPPRRYGFSLLLAAEEGSAVQCPDGSYARWLVKNLGRPMERALIRARQRYEKQTPHRRAARRLHRAYARKRRGRA